MLLRYTQILLCICACVLSVRCSGAEQTRAVEIKSEISQDPAGMENAPFKGWVETRIDTDEALSIVSFPNSGHGWVGSKRGRLYRTADGGQTWQPLDLQPPGGSYLEDVTFVSDSLGWAALTKYVAGKLEDNTGYVLHTIDGGDTWRIQNSSSATQVYRVRFINENEGWVVGRRLVMRGVMQDEPFVLHTTDQGAHWNDVSGIPTKLLSDWRREVHDFITDVYTKKPTEASFLTLRGRILNTSDGGESWRQVGTIPKEPPQTNISRLGYTQNDRPWVSGGADSIEGMWGVLAYKGESDQWTKYRSDVRFEDTIFLKDNQILVCGSAKPVAPYTPLGKERDGVILYSSNEGRNWVTVYRSSPASNINALALTNGNQIWAVGDGGLILRSKP